MLRFHDNHNSTMFRSTHADLKWPPFAARGRLWRHRLVGIFPSKVWPSLKSAASYLLWNALASSRVCLHRCHGCRIKGRLLPWLFIRLLRESVSILCCLTDVFEGALPQRALAIALLALVILWGFVERCFDCVFDSHPLLSQQHPHCIWNH